jgi:hypothetical protein
LAWGYGLQPGLVERSARARHHGAAKRRVRHHGAGKAKIISFPRTSQGAKFLKRHKDFTTQLEVTLVGGKKSAHQVRVP